MTFFSMCNALAKFIIYICPKQNKADFGTNLLKEAVLYYFVFVIELLRAGFGRQRHSRIF